MISVFQKPCESIRVSLLLQAQLCGSHNNWQDVFLFTFSSLLADVEQSVKDAGEEAGKLKEEGFQAIKMFVGLLSINDDLQRVAAVRKAIGPKVFLSSENKRTLLLGGSYG